MKTIVVNLQRYQESRDVLSSLVFRGTSWAVHNDVKDFAILQIYNGIILLASFKSWESVYFSDELAKESSI